GGGGGGKRSAGTRRHGREPGSPAGGGVSLAAAKRVVLDSGLVLLLLENHDLPIVSVQTFSRASQLYESEDQAGLANLVGMLLEDGTKGRTADQIAAAMEFVGGRLGTGSSGVEATVLAKDAGLALDILFDILMNASFPEDMVDQKKEQVLAEIAGARDVPREQARNAYAELLYGRHPLHRPAVGYEDTVKSLTRDDCVRHFRKYFIPNNTIVALVGDFDAAAIEAGIRERTASWKMQLLDLPGFAEAAKLEKGVTKGVPLPNAKQLNVYMGHLGIRRSDPDYYALLVMDNVLGTGAGFTDRMSRTIRDEMGLVYAVGANITGSAGIEPGTFRVFLATVPEKYVAARGVVAKEIERIRKEPVTADELSSAKAYLTGSFVFDFESNAQLADALLYVERHGLGLDYMKTYVEKVKSVTAEDVLRVAAKHLDPAALSVVVAGPVDEKGELTGGK
ncbi:MAG: insulinase family protein, partial [Planctomycetes bacterium]|nr:insulinase family protein [Planctomycetota bacterium]